MARSWARSAAAHAMISGPNGRREQDTQQWLDAFTQATHQALADAGVNGQAILGIGVSGQQHGLVLLDDQGQVLRPAKLWCDTETTPENDRLLAHLGGEDGSLERLGVVIAAGLHGFQAALDAGAASPGFRTHRQRPAASRLPQLLAHRPPLQRIRRRLGNRLLQRTHPPMGRATVTTHRPQRSLASSAAGTDRGPSTGRTHPAGHCCALGHQPRGGGGQWWWRQYDGRHRHREHPARRDHHEPRFLRYGLRLCRRTCGQSTAVRGDVLLLQRWLAAVDLHH